jgi:hypothetical protein
VRINDNRFVLHYWNTEFELIHLKASMLISNNTIKVLGKAKELFLFADYKGGAFVILGERSL